MSKTSAGRPPLKSPDAFRTISEAADALDLPQHVLRFWETRFSQIKPMKRSGGRRYYRPADITLLAGIQHLLYDEGYTIKGVQRILREQGIAHVAAFGEAAAQPAAPEPVQAAPQLVEHPQVPAPAPVPVSEPDDVPSLQPVLPFASQPLAPEVAAPAAHAPVPLATAVPHAPALAPALAPAGLRFIPEASPVEQHEAALAPRVPVVEQPGTLQEAVKTAPAVQAVPPRQNTTPPTQAVSWASTRPIDEPLSKSNIETLAGALSELIECKTLLDQARLKPAKQD